MHISQIKKLYHNEWHVILIYVLSNLMFGLVIGLEYQVSDIYYPLLINTILFAIYLFIRYMQLSKKQKEVSNFKISDFKSSITYTSTESDLIEVISDIHLEYQSKISEMHNRGKRNEQLLSQFIHNMKTSVSVIELASSCSSGKVVDDIRNENNKLMQQLEQSLNILRLDQRVNDYMPKKVNLADLVTEVINENKTNFIYNNVYPNAKLNDDMVFTDPKWFKFMLSQIVSNAIKYSNPNNQVYFEIKSGEYTELLIKDTGIGIPSNELNQIFDLFFTGSNGRSNNQASGVGLSMVKTVSEFLNIEVQIDSTINVGTECTLKFLTKM